ncbi:MAG TPA: glycosyltransferase, partial [Bradyrhizobium sp.]
MNTIGYVYKLIDSPFGKLKLVASDKGLAAVLWENDDPRRVRLGPLKPGRDNKFLKEAEKQLKAYFEGRLK